ncbi:hypothetical protein [Streptomyces sp. NBC_01264]|uniref:hypothetical protein n=1 Tax=Streptomyces sp. NBC_01264 TaxID=2903804 RepID=UPI00224ED1E1|nr:hypothetical protein [Streptomyces sp. NBC_01264]MCX4781497.1 hypothetical protein [Streptomyces sp. NBC_01264]
MTSASDQQQDALAGWLRIRTQITWPRWSATRPDAEAAARNGFRDFFTTTRGSRDAGGTERVLTALDLALADAEQGERLSFALYQAVAFLQVALISTIWRCPACHRFREDALGQGP